MKIILETKNLCKYYGVGESQVKAIDHTSIQIRKGEFVTIVGKSGSGKSTLLHLLGGLDNPTSGQVLVEGENIADFPEEKLALIRRRKIGFVFQAFNLVPSLNVWENIVLPMGLDGRKPDRKYIKDIIHTLGLDDKTKSLPNTLSGGQQQRVAIGRALITRPALILADEPTGNLDSRSSQDVMDLLMKASRHYQQTILMITHNVNLTESVDRVLRVSDGVLQDLGGAQL